MKIVHPVTAVPGNGALPGLSAGVNLADGVHPAAWAGLQRWVDDSWPGDILGARVLGEFGAPTPVPSPKCGTDARLSTV